MQLPIRQSPKPRWIRGGVPRIDWSHPLTKGLIGCWVPGITFVKDLTGTCPDMSFVSNIAGNTGSIVIDREGPAISGGTNNATGTILYCTAPAVYKGWSNFSTYYRGQFNGLGNYNPFQYLIYIGYDNTGSSPFEVVGIGDHANAGNLTTVSTGWNKAGAGPFNGTTVNFQTVGTISCLGTFTVNGNNILYKNGAQVASDSWGGAGVASSTATSELCINGWTQYGPRRTSVDCYLACCWNRTLSAVEAQQMDADPYGFLIWPEDEIFAELVGAAVVATPNPGFPIAADLPPRPRRASPDLQTLIIPGRFGLPQGGGVVSELPPRGRGRSIDLLTSYVPGRQTITAPYPQGGVSAELPPRGRGPSIDLRTAIIQGRQGPGAQIQNDSIARWFPISMPPDFRTWLIPGTAVTSVGFKDLAGDLSVTPAFAADLNVTIALAGDLPVTPAFAADVADIFNLVGDLAPSIVFAADTADLFQFVGDLPVTPAFAGDLGLTLILTGDLPVTPAFAADITAVGSGDLSTGDLPVTPTFAGNILVTFNLAGDLPVTPVFSATESSTEVLAGDLSPSIVFAADITISGIVGSAYGLRSYGIGKYSLYTPGFQDLAGDLSPSVSFSSTAGLVQSITGDLSPSVVFQGDVDLNNQKTINGDLSPSIVFGATLTLSTVALSGDLAPSVAFSATYDAAPILAGGLVPSVTFAAIMTAGPLWTPLDCPPISWIPVEPCNG